MILEKVLLSNLKRSQLYKSSQEPKFLPL